MLISLSFFCFYPVLPVQTQNLAFGFVAQGPLHGYLHGRHIQLDISMTLCNFITKWNYIKSKTVLDNSNALYLMDEISNSTIC